ncbi:MAG TPA: hypothetical protein VHG89_01220 [Verrucomicrobiae bacterium]|nr:hypothetical protein [Verrucomicrobiae bacterium]
MGLFFARFAIKTLIFTTAKAIKIEVTPMVGTTIISINIAAAFTEWQRAETLPSKTGLKPPFFIEFAQKLLCIC